MEGYDNEDLGQQRAEFLHEITLSSSGVRQRKMNACMFGSTSHFVL